MGPQGPELHCQFGLIQVKWWYHMFYSSKIEQYMEPELSDIFWVKMVAKNIKLGSLGTNFTHMRVKIMSWTLYKKNPPNVCECDTVGKRINSREIGTGGQRVSSKKEGFMVEFHWCTQPGYRTQPCYEAPDDFC